MINSHEGKSITTNLYRTEPASASNCHIGSVDYDDLEERFTIEVYEKATGRRLF